MRAISRVRGVAIARQLRYILLVLLSFALLNVVLVYYFLDRMWTDGKVVNYAGVVRGNVQRLIKLEMAGQKSDQLIERMDAIVEGLLEGDEELGLPPAVDALFIAKMLEAREGWMRLRKTILAAREDMGHLETMLSQSETFFELMNEAAFAAADFARRKVENLEYMQLALFGINLLILVAVWIIVDRIAGALRQAVAELTSFATSLSATIDQQDRTTDEQAAAVSETTSTMEELNASFQSTAERAGVAAETARRSSQLSREGQRTVEQTLAGMRTLKDKVGLVAEQILHLSEQTGQIGNISEVVGELANQTNLLALNASVEAARAGEHGRGFAVVAGEIRKLADQSKQSVARINKLVRDIQQATNATVMATEEGTKTVEGNMGLAERTAAAFAELAASLEVADENIQQVSLNVKEQVAAVRQVVEVMDTLEGGARETSSSITQTKREVDELRETTQRVQTMV